MKNQSFSKCVAVLLFALAPLSLRAAPEFWDPNGTTVGTSVSGDWSTTASNWTATVDSGVSNAWTQSDEANFGVTANYTVTLTEPITIANLSVTGNAGGLTIVGSPVNGLILPFPLTFDTGSRTVSNSAPVSGTGSLTKIGSGTLTMAGSNTYSGGTIISSGSGFIGIAADTISSGGVISSGPLGTGAISVNTAGHRMFAVGASRAVENPVVLNAGLTTVGAQNLTFRNGNFQVAGATRVITVSNTALTTIESNLTDDGTARTLQKAGPGTLVLTGTNSSYLGSLTVNATSGTLRIGSDTALQVGSVVTVSAGSTLDLNGFQGTVNGLAGVGSVTLGSGTLTISNTTATSQNFTGVMSGPGGLVISSTGVSQQISGSNTFSGGMLVRLGTVFLRTNSATIDGISLAAGTGTITVEDTGATPRPAIGANYTPPAANVRITNSINVTAGRALLFPSNGGLVQYDGAISGIGGVLRDNNGSGPAVLTGNSSYSGGLQLESRVLGLGHRNAPGTGPFVIGNPTTAPGNPITIVPTVDLGGVNSVTNVTTVNQNFTILGTNGFELSGPMSVANPTTVTVLGDTTAKFSGIIDGAGGFTKAGTNGLIFSGANTYAGSTVVSGGSLLVNNSSGSGTAAGSVTVGADSTLGGSGTVAGPVTVSFGGNIAAGSSAGKLTLQGGLDLSAGGTNVWELAALRDDGTGTAGTHFDQVALTTGGSLVLGANATLSLAFIGSTNVPSVTNSFWRAAHTWTVVKLTAPAANPSGLGFGTIKGSYSAGAFTNSVAGDGSILLSFAATPAPSISSVAKSGNDVNVSFVAANGANYRVEYATSLVSPISWQLLQTVNGTGGSVTVTDTNPPDPQRFYRIVLTD